MSEAALRAALADLALRDFTYSGAEASVSNPQSLYNSVKRARAALSAQPAQPAQPPEGWISVTERIPKSGESVLAFYKNRNGYGRRIRACWVAARTEESTTDSEIGIYDEEHDCYYDPEGWYEQINNWDEYRAVAVHEGNVTHWHVLPAAPAIGDGHE